MRKKDYMEMRYYDPPGREWVLALTGKDWVRAYGEGINYLHFHNLYELGLCRWGKGDLVLDTEVRPFGPGMISVIPENFPHNTVSEKGTCSFWEYLFFDPLVVLKAYYGEDQLRIDTCMNALGQEALFGDAARYRQVAALAEMILTEMGEKRQYYIERIHALLTALVFELLSLTGREDMVPRRKEGDLLVRRALEYMEEHYAEPIRVEDLARACSISETHFRRTFSESFDISPARYLCMIRVLKACERMHKSDEPMTVIAQKCGFATISTLDRSFKSVLGVSPYQWKKDPKNYESRLLKANSSVRRGW